MSEFVISAEAISKKYTIGHNSDGAYLTLRDVLAQNARLAWNHVNATLHGKPLPSGRHSEDVWVLQGIDFTVQRGEVLGVIGRNGAGKSTLLKILSRITEPSSGRVILAGRVASLLEVGTGFHPELTGRENVYLNGAILGMRQNEIRAKFSEIVEFAGVEKYIDTPVKRYSSGMYVRLAFSVAAHLDPEILLVDEVLAVGDIEFQQRCLGKMSDTATSGRTIIFVSHNMPAVLALCSRCIVLDKGQIVYTGKPADAVAQYMAQFRTLVSLSNDLTYRTDRKGSGEAKFTRIELIDGNGATITSISMGDPLVVQLDFEATEYISKVLFAVRIVDQFGVTAVRAYSYESCPGFLPSVIGPGRVHCRFDNLPIMRGHYSINIWLGYHGHTIDEVDSAIEIEVDPGDVYGTGKWPGAYGLFYATHKWQQV